LLPELLASAERRGPGGAPVKGVVTALLVACCWLPVHSFALTQALCNSSAKSAAKSSPQCAPKVAKPPAVKPTHAAKLRHPAKTLHAAKGKAKPPATAAVDCQSAGTCPAAALAEDMLPASKPPIRTDSACFAALGSSYASRHLATRVPFFLDHAPGAQALENKGHPNATEKSELSSVVAGYEMCLDMQAAARRETYAAEVITELEAYWKHTKSILGNLQGGRLSFGDAARAVADNDKAYKFRVDALLADLQTRRTSQESQDRAAGSRLQ
jgi:hypothetical protein